MASNPKNKTEAPNRWGLSTADFYARLQGKHVTVALSTGKALKGELTGVDTYDIILRQSSGLEVLVVKGAIAYVHPSPSD